TPDATTFHELRQPSLLVRHTERECAAVAAHLGLIHHLDVSRRDEVLARHLGVQHPAIDDAPRGLIMVKRDQLLAVLTKQTWRAFLREAGIVERQDLAAGRTRVLDQHETHGSDVASGLRLDGTFEIGAARYLVAGLQFTDALALVIQQPPAPRDFD